MSTKKKTSQKQSTNIQRPIKYGSKTPRKIYLSAKIIKRNKKKDIRNISYKIIDKNHCWGCLLVFIFFIFLYIFTIKNAKKYYHTTYKCLI